MKRIFFLLSIILMMVSLCACNSSKKSIKGLESLEEITEENDFVIEYLAYKIKDEVIVDNNDCKFVISNVKELEHFGFVITVYCENKTDDEISFDIKYMYVNGYRTEVDWKKTISKGNNTYYINIYPTDIYKKEEGTFSWDTAINNADEIRFDLNITNIYTNSVIIDDLFTIYPTKLDRDEIGYPGCSRLIEKNTKWLIGDGRLSMHVLGWYIDEFGNFTLETFVWNVSNALKMHVWLDKMVVDGHEIKVDWDERLPGNIRCFSNISLNAKELKELGIDPNSITKMELTINTEYTPSKGKEDLDTSNYGSSRTVTYFPQAHRG